MCDNNDYYVYEHIRPDNGTCFYVGKGRGKRCNIIHRNENHDRIVSDYGIEVKIVKDGLSEEEAYSFEKELIDYYVNELQYGIDISGYERPDSIGKLTNKTFGGGGVNNIVHSDEWRKNHSEKMSGENNPMYGINIWETYSEDKANAIRQKLSEQNSNEKNNMYGVSPKERMTPEKYEIWKNKTTNRLKMQTGENNPNYHNDTLHNKVKDNPELRIEYYSRPGSQNGRAKEVFVYDINKNYIANFSYIGECCEWIKEKLSINSRIDTIRSGITLSIKNGKPYRNMYFSFTKL